jgi:hypothetical protein
MDQAFEIRDAVSQPPRIDNVIRHWVEECERAPLSIVTATKRGITPDHYLNKMKVCMQKARGLAILIWTSACVLERCGVGYTVQCRDRMIESFEARLQGSGIGGDASQAAGTTPLSPTSTGEIATPPPRINCQCLPSRDGLSCLYRAGADAFIWACHA